MFIQNSKPVMWPLNLTAAQCENHNASASPVTPAEVCPVQEKMLHRINLHPEATTVNKSYLYTACLFAAPALRKQTKSRMINYSAVTENIYLFAISLHFWPFGEQSIGIVACICLNSQRHFCFQHHAVYCNTAQLRCFYNLPPDPN